MIGCFIGHEMWLCFGSSKHFDFDELRELQVLDVQLLDQFKLNLLNLEIEW